MLDINSTKLDSIFNEAVNSDIPGVSAAVVAKEESLYQGHFGFADLNQNKPIDDSSLFRIASMTKAVTSVCIFQLIEKGVISLDSPLKNFFPEVSEKKIIDGFDDEGNPIMSDPSNDITVGNLLTHTSGLAYEMWNENISTLVQKGDLASMFSVTDDFLKAPLVFNPGTSWEYGIGIDWLGVLIEKLADCSLQEYMTLNVFEPLGMNSTSYDLDKTEQERMVNVYTRTGDGYEAMPFSVPEKSAIYSGGGGLISNLKDYSQFLKVFLNSGQVNETKILSESSVNIMMKSLNEEIAMTKLPSQNSVLTKDMEFFPQVHKSWSPGFMINHSDADTGRPKDAAGWAGIFNSYFWIDKKNEIAGLILMQMLPFIDDGCFKTLQNFEKAVYK